jgi:hypothetical protein
MSEPSEVPEEVGFQFPHEGKQSGVIPARSLLARSGEPTGALPFPERGWSSSD